MNPPLAESTDALHESWLRNRDAALEATFVAQCDKLPDWFARGDPIFIALGTAIADAAGAHAAAAEGYFRLAQALQAGNEPAPQARRWYACSLAQATQVGGEIEAARAAYCLGCIDDAQGRPEAAAAHFALARDHAERAGNPAGKAAALYRLSLLAMARNDLTEAHVLALDSYLVSREAKQYLGCAETLGRLNSFLGQLGLGHMAHAPTLDLLSLVVVALSEAQDDAQRLGGQALRALLPLPADVRAGILAELGERFGSEVAQALGRELDSLLAAVAPQG
jgi:hypothetical protein